MAQPNPVFVTPSTTAVQVETLQTPVTPVLLNSFVYPGQLVTVFTTLSTPSILTSSVLISTTASGLLGGGISTFLQQPQGFVTLQTVLPNQWAVLNSYPFRDQQISAGVYSFVTSTVYTSVLSSFLDITSSLTVENLVVTGTFFQSSGLVLNTNVSSLGTVTLLSSLTVLGSTFFSSPIISSGPIAFQSSLTVDRTLTSLSTIVTPLSVQVSTVLSVLGSLSTGSIQLQAGLIAPRVEVLRDQTVCVDSAGSVLVRGGLSTGSSFTTGGGAQLKELRVAGSLSTLSSFTADAPLEVRTLFAVAGSVSIGTSLAIGGSLRIDGGARFESTLEGLSTLFVRKTLQVLSSISTTALFVESGSIQGSLTVVSTPIVSTQALDLQGSLGFGSLTAISTSVGGAFSTTSSFVATRSLLLASSFTTLTGLSTVSSLLIRSDLAVLSNVTFAQGLAVSRDLILKSGLDVKGESRWGTPTGGSTVIHQDLTAIQSLFVTQTAVLSSIQLPSTLLAFNFEVSTLQAGYQGIASTSFISSLYASSITVGGLEQAATTMEMIPGIDVYTLSTSRLSTQVLHVGSNPAISTVFQVTSSFGIRSPLEVFTAQFTPIVYTTSNTYVGKELSSLVIRGDQVTGTFFGDGQYLSNVNYPERISTLFLSTGSLVVEKTFLSSALASSGVVTDVFTTYSTLKVGEIYLYGNAASYTLPPSNVILGSSQDALRLQLNNLACLADSAGFLPKQVVVNREILPSLASNYALGVGGVLRVQEYISPNYLLEINTYLGDTVVAQNVGNLKRTTLYVSSGTIGLPEGTFFIPDEQTFLFLSSPTVQPSQSTVAFTSTLFVNRETQTVGINTPGTFTLDVYSNAIVANTVIALQSTLVTGTASVVSSRSSIWMVVTSNATSSNILASTDEGETWAPFTSSNPAEGQGLATVAYNGGPLRITSSNTLLSERLWITGGARGYYFQEGVNVWQPLDNSARLPYEIRSVAYNGQLWVLTGINLSNFSPASFPSLHWSSNGISWSSADSGGFLWDGASDVYGGVSVAWNGEMWVAAGKGASAENSILTSLDGRTWRNASSGGFPGTAFGVVWSGSNWVATGATGVVGQSFSVSSDGLNWTPLVGQGFDGLNGGVGYGIASDGTRLVAVGTYKNGNPSRQSIQYSEDGGYTWSNASGSLFSTETEFGTGVAWNGTTWIATGLSGLRKSSDGRTWTTPPLAPTTPFQAVAFSSNAQAMSIFGQSNYVSTVVSTVTAMNVACGIDTGGDSNCLRWSTDGRSWNFADSGFFREEGRAAAYNGSNLWIAAGKGLASNLIYSFDGRSWSNGIFLTPISLFGKGTGVVYGPLGWAATVDMNGGGGDGIWSSSNGIDWYGVTAFDTAGLGVAYGGGAYVAVGQDTLGATLFYSSNLTSWSSSFLTNLFSIRATSIAYGGSLWVMTGQDAGPETIRYSGDLFNWSNATGYFGMVGYGVAYNGSNLWVAVGDGGGTTSNILYSGDGQSWSNTTSGGFTAIGYGVSYNQGLNLWIAAGSDGVGVNTLKYSGDGLVWSNATGGFDSVGYGVGTASQTTSNTVLSINQLRFLNTPGPAVLSQTTTPTVAYTLSSLSLLNTLTIDSLKNVGIQTIPSGGQSTFSAQGLTTVSTGVSSHAVQVGAYVVGFGFV